MYNSPLISIKNPETIEKEIILYQKNLDEQKY